MGVVFVFLMFIQAEGRDKKKRRQVHGGADAGLTSISKSSSNTVNTVECWFQPLRLHSIVFLT